MPRGKTVHQCNKTSPRANGRSISPVQTAASVRPTARTGSRGSGRGGGRLPGESGQVWNLERDGIDSGFMEVFLRCRETCRLMYCVGWTPRSHSPAIELQAAVRWARWQARAEGGDAQSLVQQYIQQKACCDPKLRENCPDDLAIAFALLPTMLTAILRWEEMHEPPLEWRTFDPNRTVDWHFRDGGSSRLRARIVARDDVIDGDLWLVETCVGSYQTPVAFETTARHNNRTLLAMYLLRELTGRMPAGVIFDIFNRPYHMWPRGEALADAAKSWLRRLSESPQKYFHQTCVRIPPDDLNRWVDTFLVPFMETVLDWTKGRHHFASTCGYAGDGSGYSHGPMYRPIMHEDLSMHFRRTVAFPEILIC